MSQIFNELFLKHYKTLVAQLPMDDVLFRSELYSSKLLPGNLKDELKSKPTKADKAEHFLDIIIKKSEVNFKKLIAVMQEFDNQMLQKIANEIRKEMEG